MTMSTTPRRRCPHSIHASCGLFFPKHVLAVLSGMFPTHGRGNSAILLLAVTKLSYETGSGAQPRYATPLRFDRPAAAMRFMRIREPNDRAIVWVVEQA
jgi:hypothetical protein